MILKVNYEIGEDRGIIYFKDKKIITKADVKQIEKYIEKKEGKKGAKIINWKIIGRWSEKAVPVREENGYGRNDKKSDR